MEQRMLQTLSQTKLPYFHFDETKQIGNSFGERLVNAMQKVFANGFENVIVVGNDCPSLNVLKIEKAAFLLTKNQIVLGPDNHGGCYLIGIHKSAFNAEILLQLPWNNQSLLHSLVKTFSSSPIFLEPLFDVNNATDIEQIIASNQFSFEIQKLLLSLKKTVKQSFFYFNLCKNKFSIFYSFNKGSPLILS